MEKGDVDFMVRLRNDIDSNAYVSVKTDIVKFKEKRELWPIKQAMSQFNG
jgi:hypothetical protein